MTKKKVLLSWTIHPLKKRPFTGGLVGLFVLFLMTCLYLSTQNIGVVIGGTVFFLISLSSFFFPTRYLLCEEEVVIRCLLTQREPWEKFRRFGVTAEGILLSPHISPRFRDSYRGIFLRMDQNKIEDAKKILEKKIFPEQKDSHPILTTEQKGPE